MKVILLFCAGLLAGGCSSTNVDGAKQSAAVVGGESRFITEFGDQRVGDTFVSVNAADGKLTISHVTMKGDQAKQSTTTTSSSPGGWRAKEGWFLFVQEDGKKVWIYDGGESLLLSTWKKNGVKNESEMHGLGSFPVAVPEPVLSRLKEPFRTKVRSSGTKSQPTI